MFIKSTSFPTKKYIQIENITCRLRQMILFMGKKLMSTYNVCLYMFASTKSVTTKIAKYFKFDSKSRYKQIKKEPLVEKPVNFQACRPSGPSPTWDRCCNI